MKNSKLVYAALYVACIVASLIIGVIVNNYAWAILFVIFTRFGINFWYGTKLGIKNSHKILASIFSTLGFFYLMGYEQNLTGVLGLLNKSLKIYEENFKKLILCSALFLITTFLSVLILSGILALILTIFKGILALILMWIVGVIVSVGLLFLGVSIYMGFIYVAAQASRGDAIKIIECIRKAWPLTPKIIASMLIKLFYIAGPLLIGLIGLAIAGINNIQPFTANTISIILSVIVIYGVLHLIYFTIRLLFNMFAILFDNKKVIESLQFSKNITDNKWWAIYWRISSTAWAVSAAIVVIGIIFQIFVSILNLNDVLMTIINLCLQVITAPILVIILYIQYEELKNFNSVSPQEQQQ